MRSLSLSSNLCLAFSKGKVSTVTSWQPQNLRVPTLYVGISPLHSFAILSLKVMDEDTSGEATTVSPDDILIKEKPFRTTISEQAIIEERKPYLPPQDSILTNPGTARATIAASREKPNGTTEDNWAATHHHQTVVQQHVEYWDTDRDGIIWPRDTYDGCIKLGLATYLLLWPDDGVLKKEDIRGVYDGSIFYKKADEYQRRQARPRHEQKGAAPRLFSMAKSLF